MPANSPLWERELKLISANVLLVGHTHTPFIQQVGHQTVVNPGSLGQPKSGSTKACYAVWEDGAFLQSAGYDLDRTISKVGKMPVSPRVRDELKAVLLSGGLSTSATSLTKT